MDSKEFSSKIRELFIRIRKIRKTSHFEGSLKGMFPVLNYLNDNESLDITPTMLENNLCVSSARIARVLNQLEKKKLVLRTKSKNDGRKTIIILTKEGKDIVLKHHEIVDYYLKKALMNLTEEDMNSFLNVLEHMVLNLIEGEEDNVKII